MLWLLFDFTGLFGIQAIPCLFFVFFHDQNLILLFPVKVCQYSCEIGSPTVPLQSHLPLPYFISKSTYPLKYNHQRWYCDILSVVTSSFSSCYRSSSAKGRKNITYSFHCTVTVFMQRLPFISLQLFRHSHSFLHNAH